MSARIVTFCCVAARAVDEPTANSMATIINANVRRMSPPRSARASPVRAPIPGGRAIVARTGRSRYWRSCDSVALRPRTRERQGPPGIPGGPGIRLERGSAVAVIAPADLADAAVDGDLGPADAGRTRGRAGGRGVGRVAVELARDLEGRGPALHHLRPV